MICYRDMTFCTFWEKCYHGKTCPRSLTKETLLEAETFGLGVCMFQDRPGCFETEECAKKRDQEERG